MGMLTNPDTAPVACPGLRLKKWSLRRLHFLLFAAIGSVHFNAIHHGVVDHRGELNGNVSG
jgi:hypothetical protein